MVFFSGTFTCLHHIRTFTGSLYCDGVRLVRTDCHCVCHRVWGPFHLRVIQCMSLVTAWYEFRRHFFYKTMKSLHANLRKCKTVATFISSVPCQGAFFAECQLSIIWDGPYIVVWASVEVFPDQDQGLR